MPPKSEVEKNINQRESRDRKLDLLKRYNDGKKAQLTSNFQLQRLFLKKNIFPGPFGISVHRFRV